MSAEFTLRRPQLARHARYRFDEIRQQHQIVFPEGVLVLNDTGAAIVQLCDGRPIEELIAELETRYGTGDRGDEVRTYVGRLADKGLVVEAPSPPEPHAD